MEFSERETGHEMLKWREFMGGEGVSVIFFKKKYMGDKCVFCGLK